MELQELLLGTTSRYPQETSGVMEFSWIIYPK